MQSYLVEACEQGDRRQHSQVGHDWQYRLIQRPPRTWVYRRRMFVLELTFDDDSRRYAARPAHRRRLGELHATGQLVLAGPLEDDSGALLVFRADRAEMDTIMAADPYYSTPGVTVTALRRWNPVVGDTPDPA